jgi:hypothetical protein
MAFMAFLGVMVVWCILLVLLSNLIEALRQPQASEMGEEDALELDGWIFSGPRVAEDDEVPAVSRPGADAA